MRNKIICIVLLTISSGSALIAQNVGINTTTPQATLDVRGTQRVGGINNFIKYDSATGRIEWNGASLWAPVSQQIIKHSASNEGLYAGGGKLEYRNSTSIPVFFSDWTNGNGYFSGKLGIGATINPSLAAKLQIYDGSSGITPFFSARLVVESNSHSYINLLSPDPFETGVLFGSGTNSASGVISYNNSGVPKGFLFCTNGNQPKMALNNAGYLGIGTTTPQHNLHIYNGASGAAAPFGSDMFAIESSGRIDMAFLTTDASATDIWFSKPSKPLGGGIFYNSIPDGFIFRANNIVSMAIANTGNIGIGVNTPLSKLHIYGEESTGSGNAAAIELSNGAAGSGLNNWFLRAGATGTSTPAGGFSIADNNGYRFVIDNTGRAGFGTLAPEGGMDVKSYDGYQLVLENLNTNPYGPVRMLFKNPVSGFGGYTFGGSWQISTMANAFLSNFDAFTFTDNNSGDVLSLTGDGNASLRGNLSQNSDIRLKKDITPLQNSLQKISQLNGYTYHWISEKSDPDLQTGVIAQEVRKLFPELVKEDNKGMLSVNYSGLIPVLIESIKEQQKQIDELKKLVDQLIKK